MFVISYAKEAEVKRVLFLITRLTGVSAEFFQIIWLFEIVL